MTSQDYSRLLIGVLAIQGAFARHVEALTRLGAQVREVRNESDLKGLDGLVIPGGESTTMTRVMRTEGMLAPLAEFGRQHPVFGTCAGMILMGAPGDDPRVAAFDWMPIRVKRNAYGSQVDSFRDFGTVTGLNGNPEFEMVFIRAPKFEVTADGAEVIGTCRGEPAMVRFGHHLATAFHPELTDDDRIHRMWLAGVLAARRGRPTQGATST